MSQGTTRPPSFDHGEASQNGSMPAQYGQENAAAAVNYRSIPYTSAQQTSQHHHHHHHHQQQQQTAQQGSYGKSHSEQQKIRVGHQKRPLEETWPTTTATPNHRAYQRTPSAAHMYSDDPSNTRAHAQPPVSVSTPGGNHHRRSQTPESSARVVQQTSALWTPTPVTAFSMLQKARQLDDEASSKALYLIPPQTSGHPHSTYNNNNNNNNNNNRIVASEWLRLGLGITELAGEAGSGKSQIAMSLCVQAVLQQQQQQQQLQQRNQPPYHPHQTNTNFNNSTYHASSTTIKAIYISLAGGQASLARIAHRMQQISDAQEQQQQGVLPNPQQQHQQQQALPTEHAGSPSSPESVLSQILTHSVRNHDDLFTLLREDLPLRLQEQQQRPSVPRSTGHPVALIVLDSIADLFRLGNGDGAVVDVDKTAISQRSFLLFEIASILRALSDQYGIPILVINQVSSDLNGKSSIPTLGLSWANCVNTSYLVRRQSQAVSHANHHNRVDGSGSGSANGSTRHAGGSNATEGKTPAKRGRQIFLARSARHAANRRAVFEIESRGVVPVAGR